MDNPLPKTIREARELRADLEARLRKAAVFRGPYFESAHQQDVETLARDIAAFERWITKEALEAGEEVAGARLSNGTITLTVRRR